MLTPIPQSADPTLAQATPVVDVLGRLVVQSLVQAELMSDGALALQTPLKLLRQFAALRVESASVANETHTRHALEFLKSAYGD